MASGDTSTSICSAALLQLGQAPMIAGFSSPQTPQEVVVVSQYQIVLNSELRRRAWSFSIARSAFEDAATPKPPPAFNSWPLPTDCIRVLRDHNRTDYRADPDWWVEDNAVCRHSNKAPQVRYITSGKDPSQFDPLFTLAFIYRLGMHIAEYVTQSQSKKSDLAQLYTGAIAEAGKQNAWEQPEGTVHAPDGDFNWLTQRWALYT